MAAWQRQGRTGAHGAHFFIVGHGTKVITPSQHIAPDGPHREMRPCAPLRPYEADQLLSLASAVGRLSPSHSDPERFHMDRSEIVAELRRLARRLEAV